MQFFAAERGQIRRQGQCQLGLAAAHRRTGQNVGHGGRNYVGHAHRRAQNPRPVEHARRHQNANLRMNVGVEIDVPVGSGVGQKGAVRVIDANQRGIGDNADRLLAAVIRMGAPGNIREQAGGMAQAALVRRLVKMR